MTREQKHRCCTNTHTTWEKCSPGLRQTAPGNRAKKPFTSARPMFDLITRVDPEFQDKVRNNIILAGGGSLITGLADAIERACDELGGGRVSVVKDPVFAGSEGGLAIARDASDLDWDKLSV
jgi:hypothetical protein